MTPNKQRAEELSTFVERWIAAVATDGSLAGTAAKETRSAVERALAAQQEEHEAELALVIKNEQNCWERRQEAAQRVIEAEAKRDAAVAEALERAKQACIERANKCGFRASPKSVGQACASAISALGVAAAREQHMGNVEDCGHAKEGSIPSDPALSPRSDLVCVPREPTEDEKRKIVASLLLQLWITLPQIPAGTMPTYEQAWDIARSVLAAAETKEGKAIDPHQATG